MYSKELILSEFCNNSSTDKLAPITSLINDILSKFHSVKQIGKYQYIGCCPAHDDKTPSLSIKIDPKTGKALLHCFAGCKTEEVLASTDLTWDDLQVHKPNTDSPILNAMMSFDIKRPEPVTPAKNPENKNNNWPDLVPLEATNLPSIDITHLPDWAGEYVIALSKATETPIELPTGMVLAACATAAARALRVRVAPDYFEPTNVWLVVALPSGSRKSPVQKAATKPLIDWEKEQAIQLQPEIDKLTSEYETLKARAKEKRTKSAKENDHVKAKEVMQEVADIESRIHEVPKPPQLWTSDATPERLGTLLADNNECMAWLSSEGGIFEIVGGRYSNNIPNLDTYLKSHSGDPERVDRGSRPPVFLRCPRLTIGLSPQPDVLRGLAGKPGFRGRGLLARFLYLMPTSTLGYRTLITQPVPEHIKNNYANGLKAMLDWKLSTNEEGQEQAYIVELSPDAYIEWKKFALDFETKMRPGNDFEHFSDWAGKAPGAVIRLAGILHGVKYAHGQPWDHSISKETMDCALGLMSVISDHSRAALDVMGADSTVASARHIWQWVERNRLSQFTIREAFRALSGKFAHVAVLQEALNVLVERGYILIETPTNNGPGRPRSPVVSVRPDFTAKWR